MGEMPDPPSNLNFDDPFLEQTYDHDEEYILNNFMKDMESAVSFRRPTRESELWAFWSDPTLSPCSGSVTDSVTRTPATNQGITEKIKYVLLYFNNNNLVLDHVLIQFWTPITTETGRFLVTSDQPFGLTHHDKRLLDYRSHCLKYKFNVDGPEEQLGILGLVFQQRSNAYTRDVQYYSSKEYPQRNFALTCGILNFYVFAVFQTCSQDCVGVFEFVTNAPLGALYSTCYWLLRYALKDADLNVFFCNLSTNFIADEDYGPTINEIYRGMEVVCRTHKLPLAQMWVPCNHQSVVDSSCMGQILHAKASKSYVGDDNTRLADFLNYCWGNHLRKGQGVVGRAYLSRKPCFCSDITQFSLTEYPLLPGARHFQLTGCIAIPLQSNCTGKYDYILEFFVNLEKAYGEDSITFLCSLLETMKQCFRNFKLPSGEKLGKELSIEIIKPRMNQEPVSFQCQITTSSSGPGVLNNGQETMQRDSTFEQNDGRNVVNGKQNKTLVSCSDEAITYEKLEIHFGKKLEDVAQIFHVSRSTFKRICRQNRISRWPQGKRSKVNDSPSRRDPPCSDFPVEKLVATVAHMTPLVAIPPEVRTITIKAAYGDDMIKFQLPFSSRMVELEAEVFKRLKLNVGTYKVKYLDDDGDRVLITCNKDLQDCMSASNSLGMNTIKMFIEPIN